MTHVRCWSGWRKPAWPGLGTTFLASLLVGILCGGAVQAVGGDADSQLETLKNACERKRLSIRQECDEKIAELGKRYAIALAGVENKAQKSGDSKSLLGARHERDRYNASHELPSKVSAAAPSTVRSLQGKVIACVEELEKGAQRDLAQLDEAYEKLLAKLVKNLTQKGDMNDAYRANAVLKAHREYRASAVTSPQPHPEATSLAADVAADDQLEQAAHDAFRDLLARAELPDEGMPDADLIKTFCESRMTRAAAKSLGRRASLFRRHFAATRFARTHTGLLKVLENAESEVLPSLDRLPKLILTVAKSKKTRYTGTDYDNKSDNFRMEARIKNGEMMRDFTKLEAEMFVFGEAVTSDHLVMLEKKNSTFDLPRGTEHSFEGKDINLQYDDNRYAQYGTKYYGYMLLVKDRGGAVIASRSSKSSLEDHVDVFRSCEDGAVLDESFRPTDRRRVSSGCYTTYNPGF